MLGRSSLLVPENTFDLSYASTSDINKIIKSLNVNKAKGPDSISAKLVIQLVTKIYNHMMYTLQPCIAIMFTISHSPYLDT